MFRFLKRWYASAAAGTAGRKRPSVRPLLECLEERKVLNGTGDIHVSTTISAVTDGFGDHCFAIRKGDNGISENTEGPSNWVSVSERQFDSISAGKDHWGQAEVYGIESGTGALYRFDPDGDDPGSESSPLAYAGMENGPGAVLAVSAGNDDEVFVISAKDQSVWHYTDAGGWERIFQDHTGFTEVSAGTDENGDNTLFALTQGGSVWERYADGSESVRSGDLKQICAGAHDEVFGITQDGYQARIHSAFEQGPYSDSLKLEKDLGNDLVWVQVGTDQDGNNVVYGLHSDNALSATTTHVGSLDFEYDYLVPHNPGVNGNNQVVACDNGHYYSTNVSDHRLWYSSLDHTGIPVTDGDKIAQSGQINTEGNPSDDTGDPLSVGHLDGQADGRGRQWSPGGGWTISYAPGNGGNDSGAGGSLSDYLGTDRSQGGKDHLCYQ
jgi:hypothetical protein